MTLRPEERGVCQEEEQWEMHGGDGSLRREAPEVVGRPQTALTVGFRVYRGSVARVREGRPSPGRHGEGSQEVGFPRLGRIAHGMGKSEFKAHLEIAGGLQVDRMRETKDGLAPRISGLGVRAPYETVNPAGGEGLRGVENVQMHLGRVAVNPSSLPETGRL